MSRELDRRIAIEVMGEPEPEYPIPDYAVMRGGGVITSGYFSEGGNWEAIDLYPGGPTWLPRCFSVDLTLAMSVMDKWFGVDERYKYYWLGLDYDPEMAVGNWTASLVNTDKEAEEQATGDTLPEAICNLLLALVDETESLDGRQGKSKEQEEKLRGLVLQVWSETRTDSNVTALIELAKQVGLVIHKDERGVTRIQEGDGHF